MYIYILYLPTANGLFTNNNWDKNHDCVIKKTHGAEKISQRNLGTFPKRNMALTKTTERSRRSIEPAIKQMLSRPIARVLRVLVAE